ncbi:alkaline shock response membrane anchor protein AmaP [Mycolicibacterium sp. F2034L]|uniref:alkaline shock response membrane anchor protein AmaP n=1 Tax=Mycolicibacterium sp. F2034L TaxID=2926422 RepID=UPI001FF1EDFE|nr:alkaline shock response membrane anchor protein AmaP [Mycolicibacterium sp. F2034L]MCK0176092.1 alkaline shock response membrane anchor protein AmaP [Mycolicibacterium sp. F2034L]
MTRSAVVLDRLVVALTGLLLVAGGAGALWWTFGPRATAPLALGPAATAVDQTWWPWAGGAAGVIVILVGLRWLAAHRRPPRARTLNIGRGMTADVASLADAAAVALEARPDVVAAGARSVTERGVPTVMLTATVAARAGLPAAVAAVDQVSATVEDMLGGAVAVRSRIRVDAAHRRSVR